MTLQEKLIYGNFLAECGLPVNEENISIIEHFVDVDALCVNNDIIEEGSNYELLNVLADHENIINVLTEGAGISTLGKVGIGAGAVGAAGAAGLAAGLIAKGVRKYRDKKAINAVAKGEGDSVQIGKESATERINRLSKTTRGSTRLQNLTNTMAAKERNKQRIAEANKKRTDAAFANIEKIKAAREAAEAARNNSTTSNYTQNANQDINQTQTQNPPVEQQKPKPQETPVEQEKPKPGRKPKPKPVAEGFIYGLDLELTICEALYSNGYALTDKNVNILTEAVNCGKITLIESPVLNLTENSSINDAYSQILKYNGLNTSEKNISILTESVNNKHVLFYTK